jgi:hypothetical protein
MKCQAWVLSACVTVTALTPVPCLGQSTASVLKSIETVVERGITIVTIESDGPLPEPEANVIDGPPRIYFDLPGVRPKSGRPSVAKGAGLVTRARSAPRSVDPHVTRVVLDLTRLENYLVHSSERQAGRIVVFVGPGSALTDSAAKPELTPEALALAVAEPPGISVPAYAIAPVPDPVAARPDIPVLTVEPPSPPPAAPSDVPRSPMAPPQNLARPALPAAEAEVYRMQLSGAFERIVAQRALLRSIDAGENISVATLTAALKEFRDFGRALERVEPSSVVRPTHDLLISSCALGGHAVALWMEATVDRSPERLRNASSAAAGATMLFNLVCASIGCGNPR